MGFAHFPRNDQAIRSNAAVSRVGREPRLL